MYTQVEFFGADAPVKNTDDGVLIVRYPNGRASGDAFVVFNNEEDMEAALAKNRGDMMGRYVELFKSSLKEFILVRISSVRSFSSTLLALRFLSSTVTLLMFLCSGTQQVW